MRAGVSALPSLVACADAGADLAVGYRDNLDGAKATVTAVRTKRREAQAFQADVRDADQVDGMIRDVISRFGRIDGLVSNAGVMPESRVVDMSVDEWRQVIYVDLTWAFLCSRSALPGMLESGSGRS